MPCDDDDAVCKVRTARSLESGQWNGRKREMKVPGEI
jgi:hypothetical protein